MNSPKLPKKFIERCKQVTAKRPRTVIDHVLEHGQVTTEELKELYGYNHPPRAVRDVREHGIPIETFTVVGSDGRKIAAYRFGNPKQVRFTKKSGRSAFTKALKRDLIAKHGCKCAIYLEKLEARDLQIDHRIPYEVAGDDPRAEQGPNDFMLLCGSANRAKSWSCEHCANWQEIKAKDICRKCYWAYPEDYTHIATLPIRRVDVIWTGDEIKVYEKLREMTLQLQKDIPSHVKEIIEKYLS